MRASLGALLAGVAVLAGCTAPDAEEPTATPSASATVTAEATQAPVPPTASPNLYTTATPAPSETPRPEWAERVRVAIAEIASGEVVQLIQDEVYNLDQEVSASGIFPTFTPDGEGVWLTRRGEGVARRFGLDGSVTREIEDAWHVQEMPDGRLIYYALEDGEITTDLVDPQRGERVAVPTVWGSLSHNLRYLIHLASGPAPDTYQLMLWDLHAGESRVLVRDMEPCNCDGGPGEHWSPSGRYVSYGDHQRIRGGAQPSGSYVLNLVTGAVTKLSDNPWWFDRSDQWIGRSTTLRVRADGVASINLDTGEEQLLVPTDEPVGGVVLDSTQRLLAVTVNNEDPPNFQTVVHDLRTGEMVGEWDGIVTAIHATSDGPALEVQSMPGCEGVAFVHPALTEPRCEREWGRFSPDGSYLATTRGASLFVYDMQDPTTAILQYDWGSESRWFLWNPQGTHLIISEGLGL